MDEAAIQLYKKAVRVYIAMPTYEKKSQTDQLLSYFPFGNRGWVFGNWSNSALTYTFNQLWCDALNHRRDLGVTHFLMVHSDIEPKGGDWAEVMIEEMLRHDADVMSVVSPIKDMSGLTSTGFAKGGDKWEVQRFTLHEIWNSLPETFTVPDIVVNTGLMLVDITKPWVNQIGFHSDDRICQDELGNLYARFVPEDWNFSLDAQALGAKVMATRKVRLEHWGIASFDNQLRGTCKTDPEQKEKKDA